MASLRKYSAVSHRKPEPKQSAAATHESASQQQATEPAEEMDMSGSTDRPLPSKSTQKEVEAESVASQPAVPLRPSKPTGIVNPSPQKLPMAEQTPDAPSHCNSSSPPSMMPLRKSDNVVSNVQDTRKSREKGFVPRNVVLFEKQKKLGVRPLQSGKPPKVQQQQQSSAVHEEESKNDQPPLLTFVSDVNESFVVGKNHSLWTPVQDAVEEVYSSTAVSPHSQQQPESTSNHASIPKHSVPSLSSASDVAADTLSMLPPALREKQPKVAMVSPTLHAKPVARVLPSVSKTPATLLVVNREKEGDENGSATSNGTGDRSQPQQPSLDGAENEPADRQSRASHGPAISSLEQGKIEKDTGGNLNEHRRRKKKKKHRMADLGDSDDRRSRQRLHKKKKRKKKHKRHRDRSTEDTRVNPHSSNSSTEDDPIKNRRYSSSTKNSSTKNYRTGSNKEDRLAKHRKTDSNMEGSQRKYSGNDSSTENGLVRDRGCRVSKDSETHEDASSSSNPDRSTFVNASKYGRHSPLLTDNLAEHPVKRRKPSHGGREWVGGTLPPLKGRPAEVVRWDEGGRCSESALDMSRMPSSTVQHLESLKSWGTTIKSWEGQTSTLEAQPWERKRQRRRDEWDKEYDRGKVKKVRREPPVDRYEGRNPFQEHQSKRVEKDLTQSHAHHVHHKHNKQRDRNTRKHHTHHKHRSHHHHYRQHHNGNR